MAKKKSTKTVEKFDAHQNLIMDVIRRQAGTLSKAILEGEMNSVDAGATWIDIAVDSDVVIITDDGSGFPDEEAVRRCFKTFGHDNPEEYAEKTYGNFRMGRGQMFSFGHNIWQSGTYEFDVDVKNKGLNWTFDRESGENVEGCQVTIYLYKALLPSDIGQLERALRKLSKWFSIPVTLNDELISQDPADAEWDYESDNCYMKLKTTGDLSVYNRGAFVKDFSGHTYGRGGEVVSKQQLRLNFARNDVMVSECPIWREVRKFIDKQAGREIAKRPTMNDDERQRIADQMRYSELSYEEMRDRKVYTDVLGRQHSLSQLCRASRDYPCYTNAPQGDPRADKLYRQKLAFIFADVTLERFEKDTAKELVSLSNKLLPQHYNTLQEWAYTPFDKVAAGLDANYILVDHADWTAKEKIVMRICERNDRWFNLVLSELTGQLIKNREVRVGISDVAAGWTDGSTYIAIERDFIRAIRLGGVDGLIRLGELLLHEYCHTDVDTGAHGHDLEFFTLYHDASRRKDSVASFVDQALMGIPKVMESLGKKMSKEILRGQDKAHRLKKGDENLAAVVASAKS